MNIPNLIEIGRIKKTFGKDGKLIILLESEIDISTEELNFIFVEINQRKIPFYIIDYTLKQDHLEVSFEDINSPELAGTLIGSYAFIESQETTQTPDNTFSFREIIGYRVKTVNEEDLGFIEDILDRPEQPLLRVRHDKKEVLIPAVKDFIIAVDKEQKQIQLDVPPGLLELNK